MPPLHLAAIVIVSLFGLLAAPQDGPDIVVGAADAYIAQDGSGQSWTIGNEAITFRIGLNAAGAIIPQELGRPGAEAPWAIGSTPVLTFQNQGRLMSPGQPGFPFRAAFGEAYQGGVRLRIVFDELTTGLRVTRSYVCYPQAPAIETWSTFEAIDSGSAIPISDIGIWQLTVPVTEAHWVTGLRAGAGEGGRFTRQQETLTPRDTFEIGATNRSSELVVPTFSFSGPQGRFFGGMLWSGAWALTARYTSPHGLVTVRLSAGPTATTIRNGEPLESPHGVFGIAGDREVDVTVALQQYIANGLRQGRPIKPLVTYNTWFAYGTQMDDETVRAEMQRAASLGVELFVLDAGWENGVSASDFSLGLGSWIVDTKRFPSSLGPLGDYARSLGMKFGVWVEPERVDTTTVNRTGLARERYLATAGGRYNAGVKNADARTAQICLADGEARQWVLNELVRFIDQVRPDYLKWDNNYWINCDRTGHGHGLQDGNFAHVRGLYAVLAALRERYPDLIIENCSGGGSRLDLGMLRYTDVAWMDDVSGPSTHVRHNLEGLGTVFPPRYLLSFVMDDPSEPIHRASDMPLYFRSRMAGALGLSLIGAEFGEEDLSSMSREIWLYKRMRNTGPEPVLALLTGQVGDTPTGSWDAVQLFARETGTYYMLAFRDSGADPQVRIRPMNLWPDVTYRISASRGRAERTRMDGTTLMADGVEVGGDTDTAGHVVFLTPVVQ